MINQIIKFDEFIYKKISTYSNNIFITIMSSLGNIFIIFLVILLFSFIPNFLNNAIMSLISFILNTIIVFILKLSVGRKRAVNDFDFLNRFDVYSFPSGHISRISGLIFTTLSIPILSIIFLFLTIIVGFSRMIKGYHYFSDCAVGFLIGIFTGLLSFIASPYYLNIVNTFLKV